MTVCVNMYEIGFYNIHDAENLSPFHKVTSEFGR